MIPYFCGNVFKMKMKTVIRKIEKRDITGFHRVLDAVAAEGKYLLTVSPVSFEKVEKFVENNIGNDYSQYIAENETEIIGWADIIPYSENSQSHIGNLGMGVISSCRGQGIGTKLLQKAVQHAWKKGLKRIELEVYSDNKNAIKLYHQSGFQMEGTRKYARYYAGAFQHCHIMAQYRI